ncbi:hypothetical protein [Rhizobium sp. CNPSo 4039]|uniref:phage major capsid protein n=1 Tax=Rhizobium sp. CNPSo 4039 TaxID=3021409 RepID=UPI00254AC876|nr:hypothetical protein [Rhizobium sp. CNPSo 4039]MDK4712998.1 hypothetical protein [Rhizobium sp. CNPSo 4039]
MKRTYSIVAVALTFAVASLIFFGGGVDTAFAASIPMLQHAPLVRAADLADILHHYTPHFAATAAVIRVQLDDLKKRAMEKLAEIKDDTAPDAARTIEGEHEALLAEIKAKQDELAAAEAEEADAARNNPSPTQAAEVATAARAADILDIGTRAGMDASVIQDAIRANVTVDAFRVRAFDHMAGQADQSRTSPARVRVDERDTRRAARIEALAYGLGAPLPASGPSAAARSLMGDGLIAIAAEAVNHRGMPRNARETEEVFTRAAHTTSDFPNLMSGAINRVLEARYALATPIYRSIARRRDFRDFRPTTSLKIGDFPMLKPVLEDGEIKYGTFSEGAEQISVLSYGRAISISRQLMINDDLGAIADLLSSYGSMVALFEEITFFSSAFNANLADGKTVFHAGHNNLAGTAAAIDVDAVSLGRAAMAKQKSLEGNPMLSNKPAIIMTGPDRITSAEKLVASITPATLANVNIFSGRLTPMDTAQISDLSWYLFPNPELGSNYRWGYLDGFTAPRVRIENPFGRQGMAMSVEHDFGCGAVDYRFGYKNAGA